ncbi:MAG: trigger factor [Sphingomonadales bacterium]
MKFEEVISTGLSRSFNVVIAAQDVESQFEAELKNLKARSNMKGFRPGHAPVSLIKKQHGPAIRGQVLEQMVNTAAEKIVSEKNFKLADTPNVEVEPYEEGANLSFQLALDILPVFDLPDLSKIKLERLVAKPESAVINKIIDELIASQKFYKDAAKGAKAKSGDALVLDFVGTIGGEKFEGGEAQDFQLELGSGSFIPGFEDQLTGAKAGDNVIVKVTFPGDYNMAELAGKDSEFDVEIKAIKVRKVGKVDDESAKALGFDSIKTLKDIMAKKKEDEYAGLARAIAKRKLLDLLAAENKFEVPAGMVSREYKVIWLRIKDDMVANGELSEAEAKTQEEPADQADREDFMNIAERRVRLGLLLAEIGAAENVTVSREEVNQQIFAEARRFPGQEQEVLDYYQNNENAMKAARAPVYEDKVVDLIFEKARVAEKSVTPDHLTMAYEALEADEEMPEEKPAKKAKKPAPEKSAKKPAKKAPAKKASARKAPAKKATKKAPAKKKAKKK